MSPHCPSSTKGKKDTVIPRNSRYHILFLPGRKRKKSFHLISPGQTYSWREKTCSYFLYICIRFWWKCFCFVPVFSSLNLTCFGPASVLLYQHIRISVHVYFASSRLSPFRAQSQNFTLIFYWRWRVRRELTGNRSLNFFLTVSHE